MRLSWNDIRTRAANFSKEWANARYEKGETQSFYNDFFEIFGIQRRRVAVFEKQVQKIDDTRGFIDLFWPGALLVEQKSAGRSLERAKQQAEEYCLALKTGESPRYILLSDFQNFELLDLETSDEARFTLEALPQNIEKFGFILGIQKRNFQDQDPVNIAASELMGGIHDALEKSRYTGHDLEQFLTRLLFCLFADDTGIFEPRGIFEDLIRERTSEDGADLGQWISKLFEILNTPEEKRQTNLDEDLTGFPYINGTLFEGLLPAPSFDRQMRNMLLTACEFSWDKVSPAIFGALFQSVMDKTERRKQGAHYTTEKNIMKVIGPLFLDDLHDEFKRIKARKTGKKKSLQNFHDKLAGLNFFDPACGCGNFLIIAYRELRQLEIDVLKELRTDGQRELDAGTLSRIDVDQFYGIELGEFPARIAEAAMWMMDHIMNNRLSLEFGQVYVRIPLQKSPRIRHGDALEIDWQKLLPVERCSFILGNPPFAGAKYQSAQQRRQVQHIADLGGSGGTLDYVAAWFIKAGEYLRRGGGTRIGFVATNSITQGEQVGQLWPILFDRCGLEIIFAHQSFVWDSDARGKAHVHVVIIGLAQRGSKPIVTPPRLFFYENPSGEPSEINPEAITAYLLDAAGLKNPHIIIPETRRPINGLPKLIIGSKPIDGGYFILSPEEREELIKEAPDAARYIRPYVGSREFLHGEHRYILYLAEANPDELLKIQALRRILRQVSEYRQGKIPAKGKTSIREPGISSRQLADTPRQYHVTVAPTAPFLIIPQISAKRRKYVPIAWQKPPVIPSNLVNIMIGATKIHFALLTSAMHMAWMRHVGGRLGSEHRYSIGLVYNTFPLPPRWTEATKLNSLAQAVLDARDQHPETSLANLYDPDVMPQDLRRAHAVLDRAVDKLYRAKPFASERERFEHLFTLYERMIAPMETAVKTGRRKRKNRTE